MNSLQRFDEDEQIIHRCLGGEPTAYRRLYDLHKEVMYNVALRLHQNVQDAEDSVQEAFIKIFQALPRFKRECALSTWVYKIVLNTCLSKLHASRNSVKGFEDLNRGQAEHASGRPENPSARMILEREIAQLPLGYREVFVLYEVEGFSHREIADMLEISVGTSKSQLHKAKRILRRQLQPFREILEVNG